MEEKNMLKNVVAIERDGLAFRELIITFEVPDEDFDLEYYVRKAATDYCLSEEVKALQSPSFGFHPQSIFT